MLTGCKIIDEKMGMCYDDIVIIGERRFYMKKLNKKGFTLIELLAVIVILAVLLAIAVPAVSNYINTSKKSGYIDTVKMYVDAARNASIMQTFDYPSDRNHATVIGFDKLKDLLEKGGTTSAYGNEWQAANSYVVIVNEGASNEEPKYVYYVAAYDSKYAIGEVSGNTSYARVVNADELGNGNVVRVNNGLATPDTADKFERQQPTGEASYIAIDGSGTITIDAVY